MIKGKIVVVDDERIVTSAFKTLLKVEGFSDAHFFNSPKDALTFLKDNQPDLVISDFLMPEMNGLEFLSEVKKSPRRLCEAVDFFQPYKSVLKAK